MMKNSPDKFNEPWNFYDHPKDVVESGSLSNRQKVEILQAWLHEVEHRLDSANEGMPPHGQTDKDQKLLENLRQNMEIASRTLRPDQI
jgi:hypothetical protein